MGEVCSLCGQILVELHQSTTSSVAICKRCMARLPLRVAEERWLFCSKDQNSGNYGVDVAVPFWYEGVVASTLKNLKFADQTYSVPLLTEFLSCILWPFREDFDLILPIPLGRKRLKQRGYNQAALIANYLQQSLGIPCSEKFLLRTKETKQQSSLIGDVNRGINVMDAFIVPEEYCVDNLRILIVDDVLTTGVTLLEASKMLYSQGAKFCAGAAIASGRVF